MQGVVLITDFDWYRVLAGRNDLDEVNFWRPSDTRVPHFAPGTPLFFKLKKAHGGWIVGWAVFARHVVFPAWCAWDAFGPANGAATEREMRDRIERLRRGAGSQGGGDYTIGCLMLSAPAFLPEEDWVRPPSDWHANVVQQKTYDLDRGEGARVWREVRAHGARQRPAAVLEGELPGPRRGEPVLVRPRLGQGTFRMAVLDAYGGACAVTGEHSLPALEAAHIRPFAEDGPREVTNGLLLRSDLHRLYDKGYVGVDRDFRFVVSERLRRDFSNGRSYYPLQGRDITLPRRAEDRPEPALLGWHLEHVFRG
jgi:putative restriction endonuclease